LAACSWCWRAVWLSSRSTRPHGSPLSAPATWIYPAIEAAGTNECPAWVFPAKIGIE
jgi:hypothetical protein